MTRELAGKSWPRNNSPGQPFAKSFPDRKRDIDIIGPMAEKGWPRQGRAWSIPRRRPCLAREDGTNGRRPRPRTPCRPIPRAGRCLAYLSLFDDGAGDPGLTDHEIEISLLRRRRCAWRHWCRAMCSSPALRDQGPLHEWLVAALLPDRAGEKLIKHASAKCAGPGLWTARWFRNANRARFPLPHIDWQKILRGRQSDSDWTSASRPAGIRSVRPAGKTPEGQLLLGF